jgi:hypothetical protein
MDAFMSVKPKNSRAFIAGCRGIIPLPGAFEGAAPPQGFDFQTSRREHNKERGRLFSRRLSVGRRSSQRRKTKTLRGAALVETPRQGNNSPAPRNKGSEIFEFSGLTGGFGGIFDAPALSRSPCRGMIYAARKLGNVFAISLKPTVTSF